MSRLLVYSDNGDIRLDTEDAVRISTELALIEVGFRRWAASRVLPFNSMEEEILEVYADDVNSVMSKYAFKSVDVISMNKTGEDITSIRNKFLSEHIHRDDEVRFFIEGRGLFCLHIEDRVYQILCTQGDFINVPANIKHWFDMGSNPNFKCIRFFSDEAGWVAAYTGDDIATRFPLLDELSANSAIS